MEFIKNNKLFVGVAAGSLALGYLLLKNSIKEIFNNKSIRDDVSETSDTKGQELFENAVSNGFDNFNEQMNQIKPIFKICITGGPCAGKTTSMAFLTERLKERGYTVFVVPEVATITFLAGAALVPNAYSKENYARFQIELITTIMKCEDYFSHLAKAEDKPCVLLCDRGTMDSKGYVDEQVWAMVLDETGWNEASLREKRYDGVLHLVTAADGAIKYYTTANNEARSEDVEIAVWIDHNLRKAWNGHPSFRVIGNDTNFDEKIQTVWLHVCAMIGLETPHEYFKKFLIKDNIIFPPEINVERFMLEENFLKSPDKKTEVRVTKSSYKGNFTYLYSCRTYLENEASQGGYGNRGREVLRQLTGREYLDYLITKDKTSNTIHKEKITFLYKQRAFTIERFLNTKELYVVLRTEVGINKEIEIPPFLTVIKEITKDSRYSTFHAAHNQINYNNLKGFVNNKMFNLH